MGSGPSLPSIDEGSGKGASAVADPVVTAWLQVLVQTRERPLFSANGRQGLDLSDTKLTDAVVDALVEGPHARLLEQVVELDCSCNSELTTFPDRPLRLKKLDVGFCPLVDGAVFRIARNCPGLVALALTDCGDITDAGVVAVARGCPSLKVLNLRGCRHVSDAALGALGRGCAGLGVLTLAHCKRVSDNGVFGLVSGCRRLTSRAGQG